MGVEHLSTFAYARDVDARATLLFEPTRRVVLSWNTPAPEGRLQFRILRAREAASRWYDYAQWHRTGRKSFSAQSDSDGVHVDVDIIDADIPFDGIEVSAPDVPFTLLACTSPRRNAASGPCEPLDALDVPRQSQYVVEHQRGWCSPTSLTMVHRFYGLDEQVPDVAQAVMDSAYNGTGNWSFNVAYSGSRGLVACVGFLENLTHARSFLARGIPVVISYSWSRDELPGAPVEHSDGHLAVLCGFDANGDCIINDPAAPDVRVTYPAHAIERIWLRNSGLAYCIAPSDIAMLDLLHA